MGRIRQQNHTGNEQPERLKQSSYLHHHKYSLNLALTKKNICFARSVKPIMIDYNTHTKYFKS